MAMAPDCRNVLPTPPIVRLRKRIGNEEPAMNIMQLKKKTTCAVAIIIQHFTWPAKKSVNGVPIAAPAMPHSTCKRRSPVSFWGASGARPERSSTRAKNLTETVAGKQQCHLGSGKVGAGDEVV